MSALGSLLNGSGPRSAEGLLTTSLYMPLLFDSDLLVLSSRTLCISDLLLRSKLTGEPLMQPPERDIARLASSSDANIIKASSSSPPTIWTPPSGILSPVKKLRMSSEPAVILSPCNRMTTAMMEHTQQDLQTKGAHIIALSLTQLLPPYHNIQKRSQLSFSNQG